MRKRTSAVADWGPHIPPTDTWERVSDAEEVEVHAVLSSESSPDGARQG